MLRPQPTILCVDVEELYRYDERQAYSAARAAKEGRQNQQSQQNSRSRKDRILGQVSPPTGPEMLAAIPLAAATSSVASSPRLFSPCPTPVPIMTEGAPGQYEDGQGWTKEEAGEAENAEQVGSDNQAHGVGDYGASDGNRHIDNHPLSSDNLMAKQIKAEPQSTGCLAGGDPQPRGGDEDSGTLPRWLSLAPRRPGTPWRTAERSLSQSPTARHVSQQRSQRAVSGPGEGQSQSQSHGHEQESRPSPSDVFPSTARQYLP